MRARKRFFSSTLFEREIMSTNKIFKRVALVAAAALAIGGVNAVSANALKLMDLRQALLRQLSSAPMRLRPSRRVRPITTTQLRVLALARLTTHQLLAPEPLPSALAGTLKFGRTLLVLSVRVRTSLELKVWPFRLTRPLPVLKS